MLIESVFKLLALATFCVKPFLNRVPPLVFLLVTSLLHYPSRAGASCLGEGGGEAPSDAPFQGMELVVVGGTDGSGTRGAVALLERLGLPMVYDDLGSFDVHAAEIGGWPAVVDPLLRGATQAASDRNQTPRVCSHAHHFPPKPRDLAAEVSSRAHGLLSTFLHSIVSKHNSTMRSPHQPVAMLLGIKAPISMAIIPHLLELGVQVRFLLVVRDGRDIAFSKNQSPVTKFFNATFEQRCWDMNVKERHWESPLRAAIMWSAWNSAAQAWATQCTKERMDTASKGKLSFLTLRIEDLLLTSSDIAANICSHKREAAIASLAAFIGSPVSESELCCTCREQPLFLGASIDVTQLSGGGKNVEYAAGTASGYGKWRTKFRDDPRLGVALNAVTRNTLELFGYGDSSSMSEESELNYKRVCHVDVDRIPRSSVQAACARDLLGKVFSEPATATHWEADGCIMIQGYSVAGSSPTGAIVPLADSRSCCALCQSEARCKHFAFGRGACHLMGTPEDFVRSSAHMSGWPKQGI